MGDEQNKAAAPTINKRPNHVRVCGILRVVRMMRVMSWVMREDLVRFGRSARRGHALAVQ